jgi:predicted RNA-binding protein with PIN domain
MALIRILIDWYSLLHNWPELAPGRARHSEAAREALISILTSYQDACGTPVTVFFDGNSGARGKNMPGGKQAIEVLFSPAGKTADDLIERAAHRFAAYGEVLAVSDDNLERETVLSVGGMTSSCENFIRQVENAMGDAQEDLQRHNSRERQSYSKSASKSKL